LAGACGAGACGHAGDGPTADADGWLEKADGMDSGWGRGWDDVLNCFDVSQNECFWTGWDGEFFLFGVSDGLWINICWININLMFFEI